MNNTTSKQQARDDHGWLVEEDPVEHFKKRSGGVSFKLYWGGRYQPRLEMPIGHITGHAQSQINLITGRKSSWDFSIYSRANPTFPIVKNIITVTIEKSKDVTQIDSNFYDASFDILFCLREREREGE